MQVLFNIMRCLLWVYYIYSTDENKHHISSLDIKNAIFLIWKYDLTNYGYLELGIWQEFYKQEMK